jgi:hypothetical protein
MVLGCSSVVLRFSIFVIPVKLKKITTYTLKAYLAIKMRTKAKNTPGNGINGADYLETQLNS